MSWPASSRSGAGISISSTSIPASARWHRLVLLGQAIKCVPGRITLDVFEENLGARAFYEKHGFLARDRWMNKEGAIDLLYVREG